MARCGLRDSVILVTVREPRAAVFQTREPSLKLRPEALEEISTESVDGDHDDERWLSRGSGCCGGRRSRGWRGLALCASGSGNQAGEDSQNWVHGRNLTAARSPGNLWRE